MAFDVTFTFIDDHDARTRKKRQTYQSLATTLVDALADVAAFSAAFDDVSDAGIEKAVIAQVDTASATTPAADSNLDANMSVSLKLTDGSYKDFNLLVPTSAIINADGSLDPTNADVITFFDLFKAGGDWRVQPGNPKVVDTVSSGMLDT